MSLFDRDRVREGAAKQAPMEDEPTPVATEIRRAAQRAWETRETFEKDPDAAHRFACYITAEQMRALDSVCSLTRRSRSWHMRAALDLYLPHLKMEIAAAGRKNGKRE
jgi:hypothetical protein